MGNFKEKAKKILSAMTLEEKAGLCSGQDFWHLKGVERLGVPQVMVTDGPHGLRKQAGASDHLGINGSVPATCFPPAVTSASSWDPELVRHMGNAIAEECQKENVSVVLGPGVNIKRSPLCGRNFEYFSEDPCLAGTMAAGWVTGVQEKGVGTSLKHFAANNQEKARMVGNSVVDERALREVYLSPFERVVREAQPQTVMCSYNRINGVYACENESLLTHRLRDEWGFRGIVMTDWGAMDDRVPALKAGLDLEMPGAAPENDQAIVEAVKNGTLDPAVLDTAALRILELICRWQENHKQQEYDVEAHHALACRIAEQSAVLLKNEGSLLPLNPRDDFAVIGAFARTPRYQGAGSSRINPTRLDNLMEVLETQGIHAPFAPGYSLDPKAEESLQAELCDQAVELAAKHQKAVVCIGLPDEYESEGYDRTHMDLPLVHNRLVERICAVCSQVAVILMCGSAVLLPWEEKVQSILLPYLGGQASGSALAHVLLGQAEPGGRLAETFPLRLEDTPAFENFAGENADVEYRESILVGYGYYDWAGKQVKYPFGYGLSYTTFSLTDLQTRWQPEGCSIQVTLTNTGARIGSQVVQIYFSKPKSALMRVPRQLKAFRKVTLQPGESRTLQLFVPAERLRVYLADQGRWCLEAGEYQVHAGFSSRDLPLKAAVSVEGEALEARYRYTPEETIHDGIFAPTEDQFRELFGRELPKLDPNRPFDLSSSVAEVLETPAGKQALMSVVEAIAQAMGAMGDMSAMFQAMLKDLPLRGIVLFSNGAVTRENLQALLAQLNQ